VGDKLKITFEMEENKEDATLLMLQSMRMKRSIDMATNMLVDMINYGPDPWDETKEDLENILDILNVFLLEDK
jgi:hypothetical protein